MRSYGELKVEMKIIQLQMAEAKKNEHTVAQKEVERLCKELGSSARMFQGLIAEGSKSK